MEKLLVKLFKQIDKAFLQVASQYPKEFKCKKGCADCCHAAFDISLAEALLIKKAFDCLGKKTKKYCMKRAEKAQKLWQDVIKNGADLSTARIPCPLLSRENECILYNVRPVNCRTYGVPTEIQGKGHVCNMSGFTPGNTYPTIKLYAIQKELLLLSMMASKEHYQKRITIADTILGEGPLFS